MASPPEFRLGVTVEQASALFQVDGDLTRGSLAAPRMTTTQRDAISAPADGLTVYNTTTHSVNVYQNAAWVSLGDSAGSAPADATYITQTASSGLSAEQALSSLATGLMQVTTTTGVITSVTTSAGLAALISDETGSGALAFATSPTFTTSIILAAAGFQVKPASDSTTAFALANAAGTSFLTYDSTNSLLGIGTTPTALKTVFVQNSTTDATSGRHSAFEAQTNASPTGDSSGSYYGGFYDSRIANNVNATNSGQGGGLVGFGTIIRWLGTGTLTKGTNFTAAGPVVTGNGIVTTWMPIEVAVAAAPSGSGSITNIVAIGLAAQTVATRNTYLLIGSVTPPASGSWAINSVTANPSSMAGSMALGRSSATPLAPLDAQISDSGTNTVVEAAAFVRNSSGTPAAGLGGDIGFYLKSSTTADTLVGRHRFYWNTATHASRKAYHILSAYDTAERDAIGWGADGSAALLGFYPTKAAAPIAQQAAPTTALTTVTFVAPGTPDYAIQSVALAGFGFATADEGNTVLSVVANLQTRVNTIATILANLGLSA